MKKICGIFMITLTCFCFFSAAVFAGGVNFFYEDSAIYSIGATGDRLYFLASDGLSFYTAKGEQGKVEGFDYKGVDTFFSDGEGLYTLKIGNKTTLIEIMDKTGSLTNRVIYDETNPHRLYSSQYSVYKGGLHYFTMVDGEGVIAKVDVATKEITTTPVTERSPYAPTQRETYITLVQNSHGDYGGYSLKEISMGTGETLAKTAVDIEDYIYAMVYDREMAFLYVATYSEAYKIDVGSGKATLVGYFPPEEIENMAFFDGYIALQGEYSVTIINTKEDMKNLQTLTLLDSTAYSGDYNYFMNTHKDVNLKFYANSVNGQSEVDRFIEDMLIQSDEIDVYLLSDSQFITNIRQKKYGVNLRQSSLLLAAAKQMHPCIYQAFGDDDEMLVFPKHINFYTMGYNKKLFEEFGFEVPKTYEEYFELCLLWLETYSDDYPNIDLNPFERGLTDKEGLFENYCSEKMLMGQPVLYNTTEFKQLMALYREVENRYNAKGHNDTEYLFATYGPFPSSPEYEAFLMTFSKNAKAFIPFSNEGFGYFVINPYSKNIALALAFIENYNIARLPISKTLLYKNGQAIPNQEYDKELKATQEWIEIYEQELETAQQEDKQSLHYRLEVLYSSLTQLEKNKEIFMWTISPKELKEYETRWADKLYINTFNPLGILLNSDAALLKPLEEQGDLETALQKIDEQIQIMLHEQGH